MPDEQNPETNNDLDVILSWLHELETADSYQGFTIYKWLGAKPVTAIKNLQASRKDDDHA